MAFGINDEIVEDKPKVFGVNDEVVSSAPAIFGAEDEIVGKTATTADLIKRRRALSAPEDSATTADLIKMRRGERAAPAPSAPVEGKKTAPITGMMPFDETSEFAGMEMEPEKRVPTYTVDELSQNEDLFKTITNYAKIRSNVTYDPKKQSKKEFVADFMGNMRFNEYNTLIGALPELNFIRNASDEDKKAVAEAYRLYQETAGVDEPGGQKGFQPVLDVTKAIATDPLNFLGFLTSKAAGFVLNKSGSRVIPKIVPPPGATKAAKKAAKKANKEALAVAMQDTAKRQALTPAVTLGTAGVTEGSVGFASNIIDQRTRQEVAKAMGEEVPDLSMSEAAVATVLSTALGVAQGVPAANAKTKKQFERLGEEIKKRKDKGLIPDDPTAPPTGAEQIAIDAVNENMDDVVKQHVAIQGQRILDEVGTQGIITDPVVRKDLSARAVRVAVRIIQTDPEFQLKPNQQVSDAINRVFANVEQIDDTVLEQAITAEGLTPDAFAAANKVTVSDAARVMQEYSVASRMITKLGNMDPDFKKRIDELYKNSEGAEVTTGVGDAIKRLERESKALITSGIDTTVRNVAGTAIGLPMKAASNLMEGMLYTTGVALRGKGVGEVKQAFADTLKDTVNVWFYMRRAGLSADVSDKLLAASPSLRKTLYNSLQETSKNDVSKLAQMANVLNNAQDVFFRRAVFNASVEVQLRRLGVDLYKDILSQNKLVPAPILSRAMDDALKTSFSYMPKATKAGGVEAAAESIASKGISFIEMVPGSSLAVTFPRFMANAMAFQYRYSPFGIAGAAQDALKARAAQKAGEVEKAALLGRQANLKLAQATIGAAALAAAYDHRLKNQDTPWYMLPGAMGTEGDATDIRAVFPLAPYLAVADVMVKLKKGEPVKTAEAFQAVVGMKMPAGSQATFMDKILEAFSSEKAADSISASIGQVLGDFVGRFTQPFVIKNFYDFYDLLSEEGTVARDPNVLESEGTVVENIGEAALKRVAAKLPGEGFGVLPGKESLPETVPRLREGPIVREGQFFNRLIGFRTQTTPSPIEREITALSLDPYRLYGGSSGDKTYDRGFIVEANKLVLPRLKAIINSEAYKKKTLNEKRKTITDAVKGMTAVARQINDAKFESTDRKRIYKMRFNKLPRNERALINERYAKDHNGVTLEEAKDYEKIDSYIPTLEDTRMSKGGLASRR